MCRRRLRRRPLSLKRKPNSLRDVSTAASGLLRPGLLKGVSILVAAAGRSAAERKPEKSLARITADACKRLGACVHVDEMGDASWESVIDRVVVEVAESGGLDTLVVDGVASFASGGLHACLENAWNATRAAVNHAIMPAARGGQVVYLAPPPGAGEQADAARAGLENLARTLSVEWARHEITVVTIALGDTTTPSEAAALTAYLASPAGAYFSGCLLDLRGP